MILLANGMENTLATIQSRCQIVYLKPVAAEIIAGMLRTRYGTEDERAVLDRAVERRAHRLGGAGRPRRLGAGAARHGARPARIAAAAVPARPFRAGERPCR
ncbi:MAG: hypothetical protein HND48_01965 [Chloroflexi bacterium]|nr:hypothetical protein [Chloroflexota bacterium]